MGGYAALLMFLSVCLLLLAGFPAAFTLAGTALLFALGASALGALDLGLLNLLPQRIFGILTNETLIVVPLFILMGLILERSKIAEDLLDAMTRLFRGLPGGLALSATLVSTLLAASTGIVGATVVTLGLLCLPIMLKRDYDPALASGSIASAGTLGIIIPPSIMLILLAEVLSSAYQNVQIEKGVFALDTLSVGDLFAGALLPGFLISALYMFLPAGLRLDESVCRAAAKRLFRRKETSRAWTSHPRFHHADSADSVGAGGLFFLAWRPRLKRRVSAPAARF